MNKPSEHPDIIPLIETQFPGLRSLPWQVVADALDAFAHFGADRVEHLRDSTHRLIRNHFRDDHGGGCIFHLLSEADGPDGWIHSKESLTRYFTGGCGEAFRHQPQYQPAKWLVRVWDGEKTTRYGNWNAITPAMIHDLCELALLLRQSPPTTEPSIADEWQSLQSSMALPID
ncbi:MAG: hypothetical protein KDK97_02925 [Verrucomicrobiales bacterium]|nr:hypothetical protein [Verrucomicrobiales bacterium]MCP5559752.1 hypothetical protein [Verrucomicrobiaceae bacterium]